MIDEERMRNEIEGKLLDELLDGLLERMDDDNPDKDRGLIVRAQRKIACLCRDLCDPDVTKGMDPTDVRGLRESMDTIVCWLEQLKTRFVSAE